MRNLSSRVHSGADILDSRDVIERINELESELQDTHTEARQAWADTPEEDRNDDDEPAEDFEEWLKLTKDDNDDAQDLIDLRALADEGEGCADWRHGETLIRDSYFKTYAQELAEDIGAVGRDYMNSWPGNCIDWDAAAEALQVDYTSISYGDVVYWVRC